MKLVMEIYYNTVVVVPDHLIQEFLKLEVYTSIGYGDEKVFTKATTTQPTFSVFLEDRFTSPAIKSIDIKEILEENNRLTRENEKLNALLSTSTDLTVKE